MGGGGSHSDDPPRLENSSDGGSDGDRRDGESSDGDSSHSDSVGNGDTTESAEARLSRVGPLQPADIAEEEEGLEEESARRWARFLTKLWRNQYLRKLWAEMGRFLKCIKKASRLPDARRTRRAIAP